MIVIRIARTRMVVISIVAIKTARIMIVMFEKVLTRIAGTVRSTTVEL
jgi:hypothetical protein